MATIDKILSGAQLAPHASRVAVVHWEEDEYVITVDGGKPAGQTLHQPEAIAIARWLSTSLGEIVPPGVQVAVAAERARIREELSKSLDLLRGAAGVRGTPWNSGVRDTCKAIAATLDRICPEEGK